MVTAKYDKSVLSWHETLTFSAIGLTYPDRELAYKETYDIFEVESFLGDFQYSQYDEQFLVNGEPADGNRVRIQGHGWTRNSFIGTSKYTPEELKTNITALREDGRREALNFVLTGWTFERTKFSSKTYNSNMWRFDWLALFVARDKEEFRQGGKVLPTGRLMGGISLSHGMINLQEMFIQRILFKREGWKIPGIEGARWGYYPLGTVPLAFDLYLIEQSIELEDRTERADGWGYAFSPSLGIIAWVLTPAFDANTQLIAYRTWGQETMLEEDKGTPVSVAEVRRTHLEFRLGARF